MTTAANISKFKIGIGDGSSPQSYSNLEEVLSITGFGKQNDLLDVTNFDSPVGTREFIAGLADGSEITVECNYTGATNQDALRGYVNSGLTKNFRIQNQNQSPHENFKFDAVCMAWTIDPSPTEQNRITFVLKITGDIS